MVRPHKLLCFGQLTLFGEFVCTEAAAPIIDSDGYLLPAADQVVSINITTKQLYQTRFNFGVNFGSLFIREKWIYPSLFPEEANTELDLVTLASGAEKKSEIQALENFWNSFVSDDDWDWLEANRINSVRVPIGYWNVDGGNYTNGTRFEQYGEFYRNSWLILKSKYIEPAAKRGISILIDLHGVPGGANNDDHSGESSGTAEFWTNDRYQELMIGAAAFIVEDLQEYDNIAGLQMINEAEFDDPGTAQKEFYVAVLKAIREKDTSIPVIISDGWNPDMWTQWVNENQDPDFPASVVVDHHFYKCFSEVDTSRSAEQIIRALGDEFLPNIEKIGEGVDLMVGEWSAVLSELSWLLSGDTSGKNNKTKQELEDEFCRGQEKLIEERASSGSYFWTYKFEYGSGGGWDFREQIQRSLEAPNILLPGKETLENAHKEFSEQLKSDAAKEGFNCAWKDGCFYALQGSLIGRKRAVKQARRQQYLEASGTLESVLDWNDGYDFGLKELEGLVKQ